MEVRHNRLIVKNYISILGSSRIFQENTFFGEDFNRKSDLEPQTDSLFAIAPKFLLAPCNGRHAMGAPKWNDGLYYFHAIDKAPKTLEELNFEKHSILMYPSSF